MSKSHASIEITAKTIDLGSSVVNVAHVTRAGIVVAHPLRLAGIVVVLLAAGVLAFDLVYLGTKLTMPPKASLLLWSASGLAAMGTFMVAYATRKFVISLADGSKVVLASTDAQFSSAVTACIREAMEPDPSSPPHYRIDLAARTIAPVGPGAGSARLPETAPAQGWSQSPASLPEASVRSSQVRLPESPPSYNGTGYPQHAHDQGGPEAALVRRMEALQPTNANGSPYLNGGGVPSRTSPRTGPSAGRPSVHDAANRDLEQLIQFVSRSGLQHKDALLDLLRVVEDHRKGGPTSRDDADAHWQSFSEYVFQYLTTYEGLPGLTERVGRALGAGEQAAR
ncbi:MAG TPA: hypothetical protein VFV47_09080 [Hyphomicrobiaceae bacterium]|nr:hypothetical protein [Hyphomicrobiaceae bacterium]